MCFFLQVYLTIFWILYVFGIFLMMLNFLLAIVVDAYSEVKRQIDNNPTEYEQMFGRLPPAVESAY